MILDVVIPCAGSASFIDDTLTAVLNQSRLPDAIYLVDNGVPHQRYREAAERCGFPSVHYVRFENRLTMTLNWQRCLGVGQGDVCLMLHDDDVPLPDAFATGLALLEKRPGASCALLPRIYLGEPAAGSEPGTILETAIRRQIDDLPEPARSFYLSTGSVCHMSALFFRRQPFGFDPHLRWLPDQHFLFLQAAFGSVALSPESGVMIRRHGASVTSSFHQNGRAGFEDRIQFRTALDFFVEERDLTAADLLPLANIASKYYFRRLIRACYSWPWRRGRLRLGREIGRHPAFRKLVPPSWRLGAWSGGIASLTMSLASDLKYFLDEKKIHDRA